MASTHKHLRSSTANKRPTTSIAEGQIALNTNTTSPGLFFKDSTGATIIKVGPVHVGTTAPNATPPAGGSSGNSTGEVWLDTSLTPNGVKIWNGSAWVNATPVGSTTVQGLLELATDAETQAGSDTARAVTPASLQSKMSDSATTTSATTIASSTAVKTAYDLANAALPRSGGTVTGNLEIGTTGSLSFEGSVADGFETTIAVTNPTADRTITLPDQTGSVIVSGNASIVDADVSTGAAIAGTKISPNFGSQNVTTTGTNTAASFIPTSSTVPTNGVYLPAANSVGISTNGSGRLFVNSSGNVGVGTSSPNVTGFGGSTVFTVSNTAASTNTGVIEIQGGASGNGILTFLNGAQRQSMISNVGGGSDLLFWTGGASISEKVRITSAGQMGVGTSAPVQQLTVNGNIAVGGSGNNGIEFYNASPTATALRWFLGNNSGASDTLQLYRYNSSGAYAGAPVCVDSSGRVGIGTSTPGYILETSQSGTAGVVVGASLAASGNGGSGRGTGLLFKAPGSSSAVEVARIDGRQNTASATANDATLNFMVADSGGTLQERLTITNAGRVGINTASPDSYSVAANNLVVANSGNGGITIATGTASYGSLYFADGTTGLDRYRGAVEYNHSNNAMALYTDGAERARIDSSGRLLVGTSSSRGNNFNTTGQDLRFQVEGTDYLASGASFTCNSNSATDGPHIALNRTRGAAVGSNTVVQNGDRLGIIAFQGNDGSEFVVGATIDALVDATPGANDMPSRLVFSTTADGASSPTERLRINSTGEFTFQSATYGIRAQTGSGAGTTVQIHSGFHSASGFGTGTACYYVHSNGNVQNTNGSFTTISDAKLKENIVDAGSQWNDLKAIQIRNWNFKAETGHETHRQIGPIAQELETVCPGLVFETPDRDAEGNMTGEVTKGVNQSVLYMKAVKALQEAMERIETLEAKVAALEGA